MLLRDSPDGFHKHVCNVFTTCRQAVDEELARHKQSGDSSTGNERGNIQRQLSRSIEELRPNRQHSTASQVRAIHAIANRQKVNLVPLLSQRFQVGRPEDLSISEASQLIDSLKSEPVGNGGGH